MNKINNIFNLLPDDLLGEILSRVGQNSLTQLGVARLVCKAFYKQAQHPLVYQRLSFDRLPVGSWGIPQMIYLYHRCLVNKNPNAIFCRGLLFYFDGKYTQDGLLYLKQASNCQFVEAVYVYGLVMFTSHDVNEKEIGLKILNQTFSPIPDYVVAMRTKVYDLIHQTWRMNRHPFADVEMRCPISGHNGYLPRRNGFELKKPECMSCFWTYELKLFVNQYDINNTTQSKVVTSSTTQYISSMMKENIFEHTTNTTGECSYNIATPASLTPSLRISKESLNNTDKCYTSSYSISKDYVDYGNLSYICFTYGAKLWHKETKVGKKIRFLPGILTLLFESGKNKTKPSSSRHSLDEDLIRQIMEVLDEHNPIVKTFRMAREGFLETPNTQMKINLIGRRTKDGRNYNLPMVDGVAALIVGDINVSSYEKRDIIIDSRIERLKRISELHTEYLALQYPLLFIYAEDGYRTDILHRDVDEHSTRVKKRVTMREFFAYKLQERAVPTLMHLGRKLYQQFVVDAYTMIEAERISYIRKNQNILRADTFTNLLNSAASGTSKNSMMGNRIKLPSSFTRSARNMIENYRDAMALCRVFGYSDLFLTFTCNPKWPEITRELDGTGFKPEDKPSFCARMFKMKLDQLMKDIREKNYLVLLKQFYVMKVYTVEFRKCGLPHAHICLFLDERNKMPQPKDVDQYICAEILNEIKEPELYQLVSDLMIHGPCGEKNPSCHCTDSDKKCTKSFPKPFSDVTKTDEDGYPIYRRRDDGRTVTKQGHELDNRSVVAYNPYLLKRYQAHLNVEWCNQVASISYLFKYINKGNDRITAQLCNAETDEIQEYYDCRYVSSCEAVWMIMKFDIHHHYPIVIRLPFHLEGQQQIIFDEDELIDEVLEKPSVNTSMFLEWMNCNTSNQEARELTYVEFPTKFIWNKDNRSWIRRKRNTGAIGRIHHVAPASGDLFFPYNTSQQGTQIEIELLKDLTLQENDKLLQRNSSSLRSFSSMPYQSNHISENHLIIDELSYDKSSLTNEHSDFITKLTFKQKEAYDQIIKAVDHGKGGVFFLYGYGGTGKTFLWKTLSAALRRKGEIVLNVVSSGIAVLLLSGGRTAHSRFHIPLHPTDESFCSISPSSKLGELIRRTKLFIWDEALMVNKMCIEALDRSMRDICRQSNPDSMDTLFGGKTVVFGGDFRQILPVIQKGKREDIVDASLNSSYLWDYVTVLKLTVNMRLCGNGDVGESEDEDLLITDLDDPIGSIISTIYPNYLFNLGNPEYYQQRAILAPTHEVVNIVNDRMMMCLDGEERSYLSSDSICAPKRDAEFNSELYTTDFLNSIEVGGLPKHNLRLKIGLVMLL
ncbi:uncharacterized protein [Rutidosis leptorrhynchoides]|uniref:uncharacterized protein n=1 Tax=Rutidosis leptorrhynchoides TaxID=125765 RepID=UPI003A9918D9